MTDPTNTRPRMFFSAGDLPAIRARSQRGIGKTVFAEILRRCAAYCDPSHPNHLDTDHDRRAAMGAAQWQLPACMKVHDLAFAGLLTDNARWIDKALAAMRLVAGEGEGADLPFPFGAAYPAREPIAASTLSGQFPLAYDLLHAFMSSDDRVAFETFMRRSVLRMFRDEWIRGEGLRNRGGLGVNPFWHEGHTYIWTLAAVYDADRAEDREDVDEAVSLVRWALHLGVDDAGVIGEGPNYGGHDAFRYATCAELFRRLRVADLWEEEPRFARMLDHWVDILLPGRPEVANRCDAGTSAANGLWPILLHARRTENPVIQYAWEQLGGRSLADTSPTVNAARGPLGFHLIWDDEAYPSQSPEEAGWPRAKAGSTFGVNILRTGWQEDDLYFNLLAAGRAPGCYIHQHADAGHFTLYALGEAFSVETGYGDIAACHHAVMMPLGKEPLHAPEGWGHMWFGGHNHAFATGRHADYACVDVGSVWDCFWYYRHALLVRAPGAHPYVILIDNCNYRSDAAHYEWIMNTDPGNTIVCQAGQRRACVQGRRNRLDIVWATTGDDAYPTPSRLDIDQDVVPSDCIHGGKALGIGERPRLKATLHGYSGSLLTALVPRRGGSDPLRAQQISNRFQPALVLEHGDVTDTIVAAPVDRMVDTAGLCGEATLALVRRDPAGHILYAAIADGHALSVDGNTILPRQGESKALREYASP